MKQIYIRYIGIFLPFLCILLWSPLPAMGATIQYLFSIDVMASGQPFVGVSALLIDNKNSELYALDDGNRRLVIMNLEGVFLYQFTYTDAGIKNMPIGIAVADDGKIYIAEGKRVVVVDYRGMYDHDMSLSTIPDANEINIQSVAIDGNTVYLGTVGRVVMMDKKEEKFIAEFKEGLGQNNYIAMDYNGMYIRDPGALIIFHLAKDGKVLGHFGKISGLAGGFSMTVDIAVERKKGWVIVLDINRAATIFFDREGNFLFEFGGPELFKWPRAVAADDEGRIYVTDGTGKIRVFQIIEDAPVIKEAKPESKPEIPSAAPPPVSEPKKDEVQKIVEEEGRLLPLFFAIDSAKLKKADLLILDKNAVWLKKNPDAKINVRGYADERGTDEYNLTLSKKRAKAVMDYFVKQGIDSKRQKFIGYGKELTTDKSETGFARSRRVDFLVVK